MKYWISRLATAWSTSASRVVSEKSARSSSQNADSSGALAARALLYSCLIPYVLGVVALLTLAKL